MLSGETEEIEASGYTDTDDGMWIDFYLNTVRGGPTQVGRLRSRVVDRIDRVDD